MHMVPIDENRKISVCCVSQSFSPYIGGLARYVEALGKQFLRHDHDFRVIHFKTPNIQTIDFSSGIEMIRANVPKVGNKTLEKYLAFKEQILKVTHEEVGPDYGAHDGYEEYLEVNEKLAQDVADAYNYKPFDLLHVHDFQTLPLARILRQKPAAGKESVPRGKGKQPSPQGYPLPSVRQPGKSGTSKFLKRVKSGQPRNRISWLRARCQT